MKPQPHETRDISTRGFLALACSYAAIPICACAVVFGTQKLLLRRFRLAYSRAAPVVNVLPPEPRLEIDNGAELARLRAEEEDLLTHYRWVDRKKGLARIPLERAMELALARGFPVRARRQ